MWFGIYVYSKGVICAFYLFFQILESVLGYCHFHHGLFDHGKPNETPRPTQYYKDWRVLLGV